MDTKKAKKSVKILLDVLMYMFLAICIFAVFLTLFSKKDADGAAEIFGYQMRVVTSDSMAECEFTDVSAYEIQSIPVRSMVFVKVMPEDAAAADEFYRSLQVGDVLTFRYVYTKQVTITHRIASITENENGGFTIQLAGDNKNSNSEQLYQTIDTSLPYNTNYVIGQVTGQSYLLGLIMSFLMTPVAIALVIILPCLIIIALEIMKIIKTLTADKKQQEQQQEQERQKELEDLRRKVAELEREKTALTFAPSENDGSDVSDASE